MINTIDVEKHFNKIQHPFTIKKSSEISHTGNIPKPNKGHTWQTHG